MTSAQKKAENTIILESVQAKLEEFASRYQRLERKHVRVSSELQNMVLAQGNLYRFQEKIEQQKTIYARIADVGQRFNQSLDLNEVYSAVSSFCVDLLNFERFALLLPSDDGQSFSIHLSGGFNSLIDSIDPKALSLVVDDPALVPFQNGLIKHTRTASKDSSTEPAWTDRLGLAEYCIYSLGLSEGQLRGLLIIGNTKGNVSFHRKIEDDEELDAMFSNVISMLLGAQTTSRFMKAIQQESAQVHRLLDNMKQAVFSVDATGRIHDPVSQFSSQLFGQDLVGKNIFETVFKDLPVGSEARSKIETTFSVVFGEDDLQWSFVAEDLPNRFVFRATGAEDDEQRTLRLKVQPIWDENELLEKIMFVIEDVTEIETLEAQINKERFEIEVIQEILHNDQQNIKDYFVGVEAYLWQSLRLLEDREFSVDHFGILMRSLHTIKGNSRLLGFSRTAEVSHNVETEILELREEFVGGAYRPWSPTHMRALEILTKLVTVLSTYSNVVYKIYNVCVGIRNMLMKMQVSVIGGEFPEQEALAHVQLSMELLLLTASQEDVKWIRSSQERIANSGATSQSENYASLQKHFSKIRNAVIHSEVAMVRGTISSSSLAQLLDLVYSFQVKGPLLFLESEALTRDMIQLLGELDGLYFEPLLEQLSTADHKEAAARLAANSGELTACVLLSCTVRWMSDLRKRNRSSVSQQLGQKIILGWQLLTGKAPRLLDLAKEASFDWTDAINGLFCAQSTEEWWQTCEQIRSEVPFAEALMAHFLGWSGKRQHQLPLSRLLALVRILRPLQLLDDQSSSNSQQRKVEISEAKLLKLQKAIEDLMESPSNEELLRKVLHNYRRLTEASLKNFLLKFRPMVEDVSSSLGKKVELEVADVDVSVRRELLAPLQDILVQVIRNAVDHGIEAPDVRDENGKDEVGKIEISMIEDENNLYLEIKDDGQGIDPDSLASIAVKKGLLPASSVNMLDHTQKLDLIFLPGFSSKEQASDVSGRGVGMDIVRTTAASLGGEVKISSVRGQGTKFEIRIRI